MTGGRAIQTNNPSVGREGSHQTTLKGVLFDFDGTLVRLNADFQKLRGELQALLEPYGFHSSFPHIYQSAEEAETYLKDRHGKTAATALMEQAWTSFRTTEMQAVPRSEMLPGVLDVWQWLQAHCVPTGIVSNNHGDVIEAILDRFAVPRPPVIVGREQVHRVKPDPEGVRIALERLGLGPDGVWMIGDSQYDSEAGSALGLNVAIVASPWEVPTPDEDGHILRLERIDTIIPIWCERHGYK